MRNGMMTALAMGAALVACSKPTPGRSDNGAAAVGATNKGAPGALGNAAAPAAASNAAAPAAAAATPLNPGQWETAVEMKIAGMPPEVARMMAGQKIVARHCITAEEAAKPRGSLFTGDRQKNCTGEQMAMSGGRIHSVMACKDPRGVQSTVAMDGQYGGDSFDVTMVVTGAEKGRSMRMESHTTGRRVSPTCTAGSTDK